MARSGFHVEGLREVVRDLQALGVEVDDLKDAFQALSVEGASIARAEIPVRSGKLAASVRGNRAKGKATVTAGRATVRYAGPINYGWEDRNIEAQGFMQAADARLQPVALSRFEAAIEDVIRRKGLG